MRLRDPHVFVVMLLVFILFFGCNGQEGDKKLPNAQNNNTAPPTKKPTDDSYKDVKTCAQQYGPEAGPYWDGQYKYYDDPSCSGKCAANEKCKTHPEKMRVKTPLDYRPCYICERECTLGSYYNDPSCGNSCQEPKKCVLGSQILDSSCYSCAASCESHGLSSNKECDSKCKPDEQCYYVGNPDAPDQYSLDYPLCYTCKPKPVECKEKWECTPWIINQGNLGSQCQINGIETSTQTRTCTDTNKCGTEKTKPNETESKTKDCTYDFVIPTFIINGNESDTFAPSTICPGATCTVSVTLSSTHKLDFPIFIKPDGFLKDKTSYLLDDDQATLDLVAKDPKDALKTILCPGATCNIQVMFKPILCKSSNTCTIQTDWGKGPVEKTDTAKVDFTFSLNDKNEYKLARTLSAGATCTKTIEFQPSPCKSSTLAAGATCTMTIGSETWTCIPGTKSSAGATATGAMLAAGATCTIPITFQPAICGEWGTCTNGIQTRTCTDANNCGTTSAKPATSQSCQTCTENWQCGEFSSCSSGTQTRTCTDLNSCGTTSTKPAVSQTCQTCTESWTCGEYGNWGDWSTCPESGTQTRTRTRSCTDGNNCGTTASKPPVTETGSQSCTYTPTQQKAEYSSHESSLGSNIGNLDYNGASVSRDLSTTSGTYGYKILSIPAKNTITVCVSANGPLGFFYYPQYHYGFDFTDTTPGCTDIYNKNDWANGVLVHLGDPAPANVNAQITVTKK